VSERDPFPSLCCSHSCNKKHKQTTTTRRRLNQFMYSFPAVQCRTARVQKRKKKLEIEKWAKGGKKDERQQQHHEGNTTRRERTKRSPTTFKKVKEKAAAATNGEELNGPLAVIINIISLKAKGEGGGRHHRRPSPSHLQPLPASPHYDYVERRQLHSNLNIDNWTYLFPKRLFQKSAASAFVMRN